MKRSFAVFLTALPLGAAGSALRVFSLLREFDPETNAMAKNTPLYWALAALCFACAVIMFLLLGRKKLPKSKAQRLPMVWLCVELPAVFLLLLVAVLDLLRFAGVGDHPERGSIPVLVFSLFTVLTAFCLLIVALRAVRGHVEPGYGIYLTAPVFWAGFNLILDFWGHAGNPILGSYVFNLMAYVFLTLMLYGAAAAFYIRKSKRRSMFTAGMGMFFSMVALLPPVITRFFGGGAELPRAAVLMTHDALMFIFIFLHGAALLWAAEKNTFYGNYSKEKIDPAPEGDPLAPEEIGVESALNDEISELKEAGPPPPPKEL